jgi:hypothetical protein
LNRISISIAAAAAAVFFASAAAASTVAVTPTAPQGWSSPAGENSAGASATITSTSAHDGNGSLELSGDRTRFVLGDLYSPTSNLGLLSNFTDAGFSYRIDPTSTNTINPGYSPAMRITFWNNGVKDELVFEQAYQPGGYGAEAAIGDWNTTASDATFYLKSNGNENVENTLSGWLSSGQFANAYVSAVYVGNGSGEGDGYHAFVDDVRAGGNVFNFEVGGGVPEPASWAMMIVGLGGIGAAVRRRQRASTTFA